MTIDTRDITRLVIPDECPDSSYLEQTGLGFEDRLAEYRNGDFYFVGVRASIELEIPSRQGGVWNLQTITSPGLWGIESDSSEEYLAEVFSEEKTILIEMLETMGIECEGVSHV